MIGPRNIGTMARKVFSAGGSSVKIFRSRARPSLAHVLARKPASETGAPQAADVCLILEGSYPYVFGGVSGWTQALIESQPQRRFAIVAMAPDARQSPMKYKLPINVTRMQDLPLAPDHIAGGLEGSDVRTADLATLLTALASSGQPESLGDLMAFLKTHAPKARAEDLTNSPLAWQVIRLMYETCVPGASFLQFFWAWRAFFGSVFSVLLAELPQAATYHAVATGYAGLLAARARIETGRRVILTEHGIYTNERRIDLLLARWVHDSFPDEGYVGPRHSDIRDFWIKAFESLARICYASCDTVVALSEAGRTEQLALGADPARSKVIANGIDPARFANLKARDQDDSRPRIALIGRVVPIKDVACFIRAAGLVRHSHPDLAALIAGPADEEPDYARACRDLVAELGLEDTVRFGGMMRIDDVLAQSDLVVLTSLSESQPLVLLEAGAAGIACVATDVGACREMLLGPAGEAADFGPGGIVTRLCDPQDTASAIVTLLSDPVMRRRYGENLRNRVAACYGAETLRMSYTDLYGAEGQPWLA